MKQKHQIIDGIEQKYCKKCETWKTLDQFNVDKRASDGLFALCKIDIYNYNKLYWKQHKERINEHRNQPHIKQQIKKRVRNHRLVATYGLTYEDKENMYIKQNGKCNICKRDKSIEKMYVDHCHKSGTVRGLLCTTCNTALGLFEDDIDILRGAIEYLTTTTTK